MTAQKIREVINQKIRNLVVADHTATEHWYRFIPVGEKYASVTTKSGILETEHLKRWAAALAADHIFENLKPGMIVPVDVAELRDAAILAHDDRFRDAGGVGTAGHKVIEKYLDEWIETGIRPDDIKKYVTGEDVRVYAIARSAEMFCKDFDAIPIASELLVARKRTKVISGYAGTLDALMLIPRTTNAGDSNCAHDWYGKSSEKKSNQQTCFKCGAERVFEVTLVDWKTSNSVDKPEYAMQVAAYWHALSWMAGIRPKNCVIVQLSKDYARYMAVRLVDKDKAFKAFVHCCHLYDWLKDGNEKLEPINKKAVININQLQAPEQHAPRPIYDRIWTPK